eukprot:926053_1
MYMGLLALAVLGSPPSGMTVSDGATMNMPFPTKCTDRLLISKNRLISVLFRLGLLQSFSNQDDELDEVVHIINLLWEEARLDGHDLSFVEEQKVLDYEVQNGGGDDLIELGALKLTLFSVVFKQPSWFQKYCMPCNSTPATISKSKMQRSGGDLVKHDVAKCLLCANALGCPQCKIEDDDLSYDDYSEVDHHANRRKTGVRVVEPPSSLKRDGNPGDIELRMVRD